MGKGQNTVNIRFTMATLKLCYKTTSFFYKIDTMTTIYP